MSNPRLYPGLTSSRPPFPFDGTRREQDGALFGDRKYSFHFESLATEFESTDEGHDSGIGEFINIYIKYIH